MPYMKMKIYLNIYQTLMVDRSSKKQVEESIKDLKEIGVIKVLPTHCTGDKAIKLYQESFLSNYIAGGIGTQI